MTDHRTLPKVSRLEVVQAWRAAIFPPGHLRRCAAFALNELVVEGQGTAQDNAEAYKWWTLAKDNGSEDAKSNLEKLEPKMTPEQIAEGRRRVEAWKKAHK